MSSSASVVGLLTIQLFLLFAGFDEVVGQNGTTALPLTLEEEADICQKGGGGLIFPLFTKEYEWNKGLRAFLYFLGMIWSFAGVALFADSFMCAIEVITSKQKVLLVDGDQKFVKVWNPTVANLTLLALGSSAPEILLSLIEISGNKFFSGSLGPSTIVGSAAFNLLVILSICIMAVKEFKKIREVEVYMTTALASVLAYVWLVIILLVSSPDVIRWYEAILTALFFPMLVYLCYLLDAKKYCFKKFADKVDEPHVTEVDDRGRTMTGNRTSQLAAKRMVEESVNRRTGSASSSKRHGSVASSYNGFSDFNEAHPMDESMQATIIEELDEKHKKRGQSRALYMATAIRRIFRGHDGARSEKVKHAQLPTHQTLMDPPIFSFNDHDPGMLTFASPEVAILEGQGNHEGADRSNPILKLEVRREGAGKHCKEIKIHYSTKNGTAVVKKDFIEPPGVLTMGDGEVQGVIEIEIVNDDLWEADEVFYVHLDKVEYVSEEMKNEVTPAIDKIEQVVVTILNDDDVKTTADRVAMILHLNKHKFFLGREEWYTQFNEAVEFPKEGNLAQKIVHVIMLPWKFLDALTPPTTINGALPAFVVSLGLIALATVFIGDLAGLFGCCLGLSPTITAITFVALGTSLPDTFASRSAAINELTGDAAVTNVTGSNSVNVFLGLGLSWSLASIYWESSGPNEEWRLKVPLDIQQKYPDGVFYVESGDLGFGVIVFTVCSIIAFMVLKLQRNLGGELGGPYRYFVGAGFVFMWMMYIILSSLVSEKIIKTSI
eukprot:m.341565 g.341565  ORF g.341565 m.341565 type:complete len:777 (-) comp20201_c0_seq1:82-2412(-)